MRRRHKGLVLLLAFAVGLGAFLAVSTKQSSLESGPAVSVIKDSATRESKRARPLDWVFPTFNVPGI